MFNDHSSLFTSPLEKEVSLVSLADRRSVFKKPLSSPCDPSQIKIFSSILKSTHTQNTPLTALARNKDQAGCRTFLAYKEGFERGVHTLKCSG